MKAVAKLAVPLSEEISAAALKYGILPEEWISKTIDRIAKTHATPSKDWIRSSGPWNGWVSISHPENSIVTYRSVDGEEIVNSEIEDNRFTFTDIRRPWRVYFEEGGLLNARKALRTFSTAASAKRALDAFKKQATTL